MADAYEIWLDQVRDALRSINMRIEDWQDVWGQVLGSQAWNVDATSDSEPTIAPVIGGTATDSFASGYLTISVSPVVNPPIVHSRDGRSFPQSGYVSNWRFFPFLIGFRRCNKSATTEVLWHQGEKESHSLRQFYPHSFFFFNELSAIHTINSLPRISVGVGRMRETLSRKACFADVREPVNQEAIWLPFWKCKALGAGIVLNARRGEPCHAGEPGSLSGLHPACFENIGVSDSPLPILPVSSALVQGPCGPVPADADRLQFSPHR